MRCRYCREPAGWWHRQCRTCRQLLRVYLAQRGSDMASLLSHLEATGAPSAHIERFLAADPHGHGSLRDQIAADMTNQVLSALGQRGRQTAADVKRIRERGGWVGLDRRPHE